MGARDSKPQVLSYEEAAKRGKLILVLLYECGVCHLYVFLHPSTVNSVELKRLKDAFSKHSTSGGLLQQSVFFSDILGETVPSDLAKLVYTAWGGTSKGIGFKDLLCGLVLLTRGHQDEKCKCK